MKEIWKKYHNSVAISPYSQIHSFSIVQSEYRRSIWIQRRKEKPVRRTNSTHSNQKKLHVHSFFGWRTFLYPTKWENEAHKVTPNNAKSYQSKQILRSIALICKDRRPESGRGFERHYFPHWKFSSIIQSSPFEATAPMLRVLRLLFPFESSDVVCIFQHCLIVVWIAHEDRTWVAFDIFPVGFCRCRCHMKLFVFDFRIERIWIASSRSLKTFEKWFLNHLDTLECVNSAQKRRKTDVFVPVLLAWFLACGTSSLAKYELKLCTYV